MKKLRVLVLVHPDLLPPDSLAGQSPENIHRWKTEYNVVHTLRGLGHEVRVLGVQYEVRPIRQVVEEWAPHVVYNLLEEFHSITEFDQHVASDLELLRVPYTGCSPRGMTIARDKALAKKIATARVKHDARYPEERGIFQRQAIDLTEALVERIARTARRLYRLLQLTGYARLDDRLREDGELFFLEANPNPEIAPEEEFASAAAAAGIAYPALLQKFLNLRLGAART